LPAAKAANTYLATHPRAKTDTHLTKLKKRAATLRIGGWVTLDLEQRTITIGKDADALEQATKLDGCYVLKTDLAQTAASKEIIHERYKDLALVERVFRQSKTVHLEMRPIHVRLESRTRGHAFVVMLAYSIIQARAKYWRHLDLTVQEGLDQLATLCLNEIHLPDQSISYQLPTPRDTIQKLLDAAHVKLPIKIVPKKPGRNH
jgi:transposase